MSKLLKLNGFITVNEAAEYLSKALEEHVSIAELYQLVLNKDLVISARLDASERALLGQYIPFTAKDFLDLLKRNQVPKEWEWVDADKIYFDEKVKQCYALNSSITHITGCWDFTMLGTEATVIDHNYRIQAANSVDGGLFGVELKISREDILLTNGDQIAKLQPENQSKQHIIFDYFLNKLVFKKQELRRFIQSLEDESPVLVQEKTLSSKERNTFLSIINALLKEQGICPSDKGITPAIRLMTETTGTPISENTIRKILKQISDTTN